MSAPLRPSSSALFSTFRSATNTTLRNPSNKRFFTPSAANMVIKTYFDVTWTGPEVQVDQKGNVTSTGAVKGKLLPIAPLCLSAPRLFITVVVNSITFVSIPRWQTNC